MSSRKRGKGSTTLSAPLVACQKLLSVFQKDPICEAFLDPVDWEAIGLLDYPEYISEPMDLGTIEDKLKEGAYATINSFAYDMRLVWKNCMRYNRPDSDLYETAERLSRKFEKGFADIKKKHPSDITADSTDNMGKQARHKFSENIHLLSNVQLGMVVDIILRNCPDAITDDDEDLSIEMNDIDDTTFDEISTFLEQSLSKTKKRKTAQ